MDVCGSGKERTVNARPHLLTPKSVPKLRPKSDRRKKLDNTKGRTIFRQPLLATLPKLNSPTDVRIGAAANLPILLPPSPNTSPSLTRNESFISDISSSSELLISKAGSISGSELSLASYDDDETCSLVSDMTDQTSTVGDYNIGEYPLTTEWIKTHGFNQKGGENMDIDIASVASDEASSIGFDSVSISSDFTSATSPIQRDDSFNSIENRVLKISTSLEMPVTSVPSSQPNNQVKGNKTENTNAGVTVSVMDLKRENEHFRRKVTDLKQSLKLSEADIAILVSSKQQLQLQYHETKEKKRSLGNAARKYRAEVATFKQKLERTEKEFDDYKVMNNSYTANSAIEKQTLEDKLRSTMVCLDEVRNERDACRSDATQQKHQVALLEAKVTRMENEAEKSLGKMLELEKQLESRGVGDEDSGDFISHLKNERSANVRKLQDTEYELMQMTMANQTMEQELNSIKDEKDELKQLVDVNEHLLRKLKQEHHQVVDDLSQVRIEKSTLDDAVGRLYRDLNKVGESFSRLKQQMNEKTSLAENLSEVNADMQEKLKNFSDYTSDLETTNANLDMKISDKNVQIGQYVFKNKQLTKANNKLSSQVQEQETSLNENNRTWKQAIEREKQMLSDLKLKDEKLLQEQKRNKENEEELERVRKLVNQFELSVESNKSLQEEVTKMRLNNTELQSTNQTLVNTVQKYKDKSVNREAENESSMKHEKEKNEQLQIDCKNLQEKLDVLQREHVNSLKQNETLVTNAMEHEDKQSSDNVNQILAELQASRRDLTKERDKLSDSLKESIIENESLQRHLDEIKMKFATLADQQSATIDDLTKEINEKNETIEAIKYELNQHSQSSVSTHAQLSSQLTDLRSQNDLLVRDLMKAQNDKDDLERQLNEEKELHERTKLLHQQSLDEMSVAKDEMNNLQERLSEALTNVKPAYSDKEVEQIIHERNVLKDAVAKQQEYVGSLHKHYDAWAKETVAKMKNEIHRSTVANERERISLTKERDELLTQVTKLEQKLAHGTATNKNLFVDVGSQTEHDFEPVATASSVYSEHLLDTASTQTCTVQSHDTSTQTKHKFEPAVSESDSVYSEKLIETIATQTCSVQMLNSSAQTQHSSDITAESVYNEHIVDTVSTQTRIVQQNDSTQTHHEYEPLSHSKSVFSEHLVDTVCTQTRTVQTQDSAQQTQRDFEPVSHSPSVYSDTLVKATESKVCSVQSYKSTQTDHEDEPLSGVKSAYSEHIVDTVSTQTCLVQQNDSTQTHHENEYFSHTVSPVQQQHTQMKSDVCAVQVHSGTQTEHSFQPLKELQSVYSEHLVDTASTQTCVVQHCDSTQTQHENEPLSDSKSVFSAHLVDNVATQVCVVQKHDGTQTQIDNELVHDLKYKPLKETLLHKEEDTKAQSVSVNTGTQTSHEYDTVSLAQPAYSEHLHESVSTQTSVVHRSTSSSQTSHDNAALPRPSSTELRAAKRSHRSSQTDHDFMPVSGSNNRSHTIHDGDVMNAQQKSNEINRDYNLTREEAINGLIDNQRHAKGDGHPKDTYCLDSEQFPMDIHAETGVFHHLSPVKLNVSKRQLRSSSSQTDLDISVFLKSNENFYHLTPEVDGREFGSQTDHGIHFMPIKDDESAYFTKTTATQSTQTEHDDETLPNLLKQVNDDSSVDVNKENNNLCSKCKTRIDDETCNNQTNNMQEEKMTGEVYAPTPMAILEAMEGKKLKAYKQTVKVLKKKLNVAEKRLQELKRKLDVKCEGFNVAVQCEIIKQGIAFDIENDERSGKQHLDRTIKELELALEENKTTKDELTIAKKSHAIQVDTLKRRNLADKKKNERKSIELTERLNGLTESNKDLRKSVTLLQVKVSEKSRLLTSCQKDKQRYQSRARRLQASLRSLSWIGGKGVKGDGGEGDVTNVDDDFPSSGVLPEIKENTNALPSDAEASSSSSTTRKEHKLPNSVHIIEETLKNLQSEMVALEKQVQEHNVAVRQNNYDWVQLKHTSPTNQRVNKETPARSEGVNKKSDAIAAITDIV